MTAQTPSDILKQATGMSIGWSIVMIVLGFLAVLLLLLPFGTGLGVSMMVGWIVFSVALCTWRTRSRHRAREPSSGEY